MSVEPSTIASLLSRSLLVALFALAACDSDSTPIVQAADGGASLQLAPTNALHGMRSLSASEAVPGRDGDYQLGANDRIRIIVFGQPTLTGEYSLDSNGVLAFPLIGNIPALGVTTAQLRPGDTVEVRERLF
jgi:polysaccharide export outer membrane protein